MSTATITSKGQITIPAPIRQALGLDTGNRVECIETEPGHYEVAAATVAVTALKGLAAKPATPVGVEDMNKAIHERAARTTEP